jgi:DNA-binding NarL/FixJ family response regulator
MIKVFLIDDQSIVRLGIASLLSMSDNIKVVGQAENGQDLIQQLTDLESEHRPDVLLMDIRMPKLNGPDTLIKLNSKNMNTPTLLLTTFNDLAAIRQGIQAGALGCLLKDAALETLISAIIAISQGKKFFSAELTSLLQQPIDTNIEQLSLKETDILQRINNGHSNKEIAQQLHLSEGTIKNHTSNIFAKLNVRGRTQATAKAKELSII